MNVMRLLGLLMIGWTLSAAPPSLPCMDAGSSLDVTTVKGQVIRCRLVDREADALRVFVLRGGHLKELTIPMGEIRSVRVREGIHPVLNTFSIIGAIVLAPFVLHGSNFP